MAAAIGTVAGTVEGTVEGTAVGTGESGPPSPPAAQGAPPPTPASRRKVQLPPWTWSYVTFRFGDGLTSALVPLAAVLHYGEPLWALALMTASINLASVPATFIWGKVVDQGRRRRRLVVSGFAVAACAMAGMATLPPFPLFVLLAMAFTVFGVATAPAASVMVLQRVPRSRWGRTTGALSRRTGFAYVTGMLTAIAIAAPPGFWRGLGTPWDALAANPYLGAPHFQAQFAVASLLAAGAAAVALQHIPSWQPPLPREAPLDAGFVAESQRRFERPVYFPGRLFSVPTLKAVVSGLGDPHRLWPLGYAMTFMGSVCFFASYPGVLSVSLGLSAGLVLLAQLPSNLVSPISYPWAGRWGARVGESRGILHGSVLRTLALPVFAATIAFAGADALPAILVLHGLMGLSFALLQVNGPVLMADVHPGGRGPGVGTYHAAVGTGTLLGSLLAAGLLRAFDDYRVTYLFAVAIALLGFLLLFAAHRRRQRELHSGRPIDSASASVLPPTATR